MMACGSDRAMPSHWAVALTISLTLLAGCTQSVPENRLPAKADALFALSATADLAYTESRWVDAARAYQQLTEWVPEDPYGWFRLGNVYTRQGHFEAAATAYQTSIKRSPAHPKPWYNLATTHLLSAQHALWQSRNNLPIDDPARKLITTQLKVLDSVIYQRFVDSPGR